MTMWPNEQRGRAAQPSKMRSGKGGVALLITPGSRALTFEVDKRKRANVLTRLYAQWQRRRPRRSVSWLAIGADSGLVREARQGAAAVLLDPAVVRVHLTTMVRKVRARPTRGRSKTC